MTSPLSRLMIQKLYVVYHVKSVANLKLGQTCREALWVQYDHWFWGGSPDNDCHTVIKSVASLWFMIVQCSRYGLFTYIRWKMATWKGESRYIFFTWSIWPSCESYAWLLIATLKHVNDTYPWNKSIQYNPISWKPLTTSTPRATCFTCSESWGWVSCHAGLAKKLRTTGEFGFYRLHTPNTRMKGQCMKCIEKTQVCSLAATGINKQL